MFRKAYGYILRHPATERGYWGNWYYKRRYEAVLESLSEFCGNKKTMLLDLGCGKGFYARYLRDEGSECSYIGCDLDGFSLRFAYRDQSIDYVKCDLQQCPFRARSVSVVLCSEVLEHLPFPYATLEEISKITTKTLMLTFPEEPLLSVFGDSHPEHISVINKQLMTNLLVSKGFRIIESSQIFTSFIPCGILEFLRVPRNNFTQTVVSKIDRLLERITPARLVPHRTILIKAALAHSEEN
jgi:SAM-dependent methyltransferase